MSSFSVVAPLTHFFAFRFCAKIEFQNSFSSNAGDQLLCPTFAYSLYFGAKPGDSRSGPHAVESCRIPHPPDLNNVGSVCTRNECPLADAIHSGDTLAAAIAYRELGVSTFPVKLNGTKEPVYSGWREYAQRLPTRNELRSWHSGRNPYGIAATGGEGSGNLAVLDFETWLAFTRWGEKLTAAQRARLARCPVAGTPKGGAHVYARLEESVKGMKLARIPSGETLIEIRGCQHYVLAPGSPARCHPLNAPPGPVEASGIPASEQDDPRLGELAKMPADMRAEAEELLNNGLLWRRILGDIAGIGVVGENDLAGFSISGSGRLVWAIA